VTTVGALRETAAGERRVAVVPDTVQRLRALGFEVLVERTAGERAACPDEAYADAGAQVVARDQVWSGSEVVLAVQPPELPEPSAHVVAGLFDPLRDLAWFNAAAQTGATVLSLDGLPRTLSRAQTMDALTSQANVAGYKAVLLAANLYPGYFPMLMTAAGTVRPASVLVLGAGVAGLQAMATARRLGAVVTGWDVRPAARADIAATGAGVLDLADVDGSGTGGYARQLSQNEEQAVQEALAKAVLRADVVITTARVPGRLPPVLVSAETVGGMAAGAVLIDLASCNGGGNVAGSVPDETRLTERGVTVVGAPSLESSVPRAASTALARNLAALLGHLLIDGQLTVDPSDEIVRGVLVCAEGALVRPDLIDAQRRAS
jgi:NAD(P) transhydrogenase subunit alpha